MDNKFKRSERNAYSNEEKLALGELVAKFKRAAKLGSRCYNDLERLRDPSSCSPKKSRGTGAGC